MKCGRYTCKKDLPDGTKICPDCGWEQDRKKKKDKQRPTIALTVSKPQRYEATKTVDLPKEKEKPPQKTATDKNFFKTLKKYKEGGKK